jgi:hypothetical protein
MCSLFVLGFVYYERRSSLEAKMETAMACQILTSMLEGRDPLTGRQLQTIESLRRPEVVRAFYLGREAILKKGPGPEPSAIASMPLGTPVRTTRPGSAWSLSDEEDAEASYKSGRTIRDIARKLNRSQTSIERKLKRLGLIGVRGSL